MKKTRLTTASAPLLPLTVAFIVGILLGKLACALWLAVTLGIACALLFWRNFRYSGIISAAVATGVLVSYLGRPVAPPQGFIGKEVVVTGTVTEMKEGDATRNLIVRVDSINSVAVSQFKVFTVCWNYNPEIYSADFIKFRTTLETPDTGTDLPLEFNFGEYLYDKSITATAIIKKGSDVLAYYPASGIRNSLIRLRERVVDNLASSRLSAESKTFLITVLTGDSSFLMPDNREAFSRAGVAHVLALSGLHVAIFTIIISLFLFPLTAVRANKTKRFVIVIVLWLFAVMTGLTPSVTRSVIMATVYVLSRIIERRPAPVNSLCFAALCILTFDPLAIYSIGFQLSFTAVIFILIFAEKLNPVNKRNRPTYQIVSWLTTTFAAATGTGVIAAVYFHVFPVYFLAVNIPFTILLPFILGGGVLFLVLTWCGLQPQWLVDTLDFLCHILSKITDIVAGLPGSSIDSIYIAPSRLIIFLLVMSVIAVMLYFPGRKTIAAAITATLTAIIFTIFTPSIVADDAVYVPRFHRYAVVMVPRRPVLDVYTTAFTSDLPELEENIKRKYADFMVSRGIDSVKITQVRNATLSTAKRDIVFTDRLPAISASNNPVTIITRGFRTECINDSTEIPDTVFISPCLNSKIADRVIETLSARGCIAIPLKSNGLKFE